MTHSQLRPRLSSALALSLALALGACTKDKASAPADTQPTPTAKAEPSRDPQPELPDGAALLAAHVEAAGGADAIPKFETIHAKGRVTVPGQKLEGTMEMWWKKGGEFYLEQYVEGVGTSRVGYDGATIWIDDPITGLRVLDGQEAASYIQTSLMFPGHDWQQHFLAANTIGKQPIDDGEVWEVELESKAKVNVILGLDTETKLIRYMRTTQITPMGPMPIEAHSEGYESVDGYLFSKRKRSSIKGLIELEETIDLLEINVPIDESKFAFPSSREQVPADPAAQPAVVAPPEPAPQP